MTDELQNLNSAARNEAALPVKFIAVCIFAFAVSIAATIHFCRSMAGGMQMPGGWTMSMMWMRMSGQTWLASGANFLLMWLAMMVAMMLPSALPTFLKTKRAIAGMSAMAMGYFAVWLAFGLGIYALGIAFAAASMQWESFSRAVPILSSAALIAAGAFQFTRSKTAVLLRCRSQFGCACICPERKTSFRLGCKQGMTCCFCCAAPMLILLVLGMMNQFVIVMVAIIITAEKLLPRPDIVVRFVGMGAIVAGLLFFIHKLNQ